MVLEIKYGTVGEKFVSSLSYGTNCCHGSESVQEKQAVTGEL